MAQEPEDFDCMMMADDGIVARESTLRMENHEENLDNAEIGKVFVHVLIWTSVKGKPTGERPHM